MPRAVPEPAPPAPLDPERLLTTLAQHGVRFVLVGALAARLHGFPRVTADADITPARDPENLARLAAALRELQARVYTESVPEGLPFDCSAQALARHRGRPARPRLRAVRHGRLRRPRPRRRPLQGVRDGPARRSPRGHHPLQGGSGPAAGSARRRADARDAQAAAAVALVTGDVVKQILRACGAQDDTDSLCVGARDTTTPSSTAAARSCHPERARGRARAKDPRRPTRASGVPALGSAADARDRQLAGTLPG